MKDEFGPKPRVDAEPDPHRVETIVQQVLEAYHSRQTARRLPDEGAFIPDYLDRWDDRQLNAELSRLVTHPGFATRFTLSPQELAEVRAKLKEALRREVE